MHDDRWPSNSSAIDGDRLHLYWLFDMWKTQSMECGVWDESGLNGRLLSYMHFERLMNILTTSRGIRLHSINSALISFEIGHRDWDPNDFAVERIEYLFIYFIESPAFKSGRNAYWKRIAREPANRYCHICSSSCAWFAVLRSVSFW